MVLAAQGNIPCELQRIYLDKSSTTHQMAYVLQTWCGVIHRWQHEFIIIVLDNFHSCNVHFDSSILLLLQPLHNNFVLNIKIYIKIYNSCSYIFRF